VIYDEPAVLYAQHSVSHTIGHRRYRLSGEYAQVLKAALYSFFRVDLRHRYRRANRRGNQCDHDEPPVFYFPWCILLPFKGFVKLCEQTCHFYIDSLQDI
jgi:hypothetical protein